MFEVEITKILNYKQYLTFVIGATNKITVKKLIEHFQAIAS